MTVHGALARRQYLMRGDVLVSLDAEPSSEFSVAVEHCVGCQLNQRISGHYLIAVRAEMPRLGSQRLGDNNHNIENMENFSKELSVCLWMK